jgi:hypothetical protein
MSCVLGALLVCALARAAPASASIAVDDVQVGESGSATFTITRSASLLAGSTSVGFATVDGSAGAADYAARGGSLTFGAAPFGGTQSQQLAVPITADVIDEPSETFRLVISGPEVTDASATATIADDDPLPSLSVLDSAPVQEGGAGAKATFVVRLSAASGRRVSAGYTLAGASATAGEDFVATPGTISLAPGSTEANIEVAVLDDATDEPAETFGLQLGDPDWAVAADRTAVATIADDDEPPPAPPAADPKPPAPTTGSGQPSSTVSPPAPPAVGGPAAGTSAGQPGLGLSSPRLKRPSTVLVTISCPRSAGRCSGRVTLFSIPNRRSRVKALRKERKLGRVAFSVAGGAARTLAMALGRTDVALLRRTGRMNVRAYAITQDSAGRTGVRSVGGTLIARTAHSSPSG